jgi:hypothetical protein
MQIFWRLVLAHFLADFTLQTSFIVNWKRKNSWGGLVHSAIFLVCSLLFCLPLLSEPWPMPGNLFVLPGWLALLILSALHFVVDAWRVWAIKKRKMPDSFLFFLSDQFIHLLLIFLFSPYRTPFVSEKWVYLTILLVLVTDFSTIFLYFLEKDLFGYTRLLMQQKFYAMAERLVTALALLLPGWWALAFLVVWLTRLSVNRTHDKYDFSWFNILAGNALAVLFGIIGRYIYYS